MGLTGRCPGAPPRRQGKGAQLKKHVPWLAYVRHCVPGKSPPLLVGLQYKKKGSYLSRDPQQEIHETWSFERSEAKRQGHC